MTEEQQKFYDLKHTTDYKVVGDDIDYTVITDHEKKEVVLQFEESDSRNDWINNLLFLPWPVRLGNKIAWTTLGYARAYKSTRGKPVRDFIYETWHYPDYKRSIRGWSFGSAMAKFAACHYLNMDDPEALLDELTTYGDVKCWLFPNQEYSERIVDMREYTTPNDAVTWCVPFFYRDRTCKVGPRFSIKELFHSDYYHQNYEKYDYSKWEEA